MPRGAGTVRSERGDIKMRRKTELPELLAPAGDFEALYAAVAAGADAVYVGGKLFSARAYAKNFDREELARAAVYCHLHGVRLYVTVNTLVYDKELDEVVAYAKELARIGADALIIADLGAIRRIRREVPSLALHASTQMSLHNTPAVRLAHELGCTRAVLARECSLADIRSAVDSAPCEIEVFLHGALCVCHSGQCLFSSLVGGRSGNRGECAQPCRLPYNGGYPLSLSDLSLVGHIEELIASGVSSLKIEGRMKSPDYVYRVTSTYRRLLDAKRSAVREERRSLAAVFSRGGFTDGYFTGHPERPMTGIRSEKDKEATRAQEAKGPYLPLRKEVSARAVVARGVPATLSLTDGAHTVVVSGEIPTEARSAPMTEEDLKARLSKTGNTFLSLPAARISLSADAGLHLPISAINALRRAATDAFEQTFARPLDRIGEIEPSPAPTSGTAEGKTDEQGQPPALREEDFGIAAGSSALFFDPALPAKISDLLGRIPYRFVPLFRLAETDLSVVNGVYLPPVLTDRELPAAREALAAAKARGVRYALVGNLGGIALAREAGLLSIGDFRLNILNAQTLFAYRDLGVAFSVLSVELTLPMARDILRRAPASLTVYGRIPLMLTERCFMKENFGCERCSRVCLTDRRGQKFPILREYNHRNLILNSAVTYMGDRAQELSRNGVRTGHFLFTVEGEKEARAALAAFDRGEPLSSSVPIRRIGKREARDDA